MTPMDSSLFKLLLRSSSAAGSVLLLIGMGLLVAHLFGFSETVFVDDVLYLEWKATGGGRTVQDGIDTFIFKDGMIRVQTVVYTVQSV